MLAAFAILEAFFLAAVLPAQTAERSVELKLERRTLEVGEISEGQILCVNTPAPQPPQAEVPDGLSVQLLSDTPSVSRFSSRVSNQVSERVTYSYGFRITALKAGTYTLGPFRMQAEGETLETDVVTLLVRPPREDLRADADRLIFADMSVTPTSLYVTESFMAKLRIGIRKVEYRGSYLNMNVFREVLDQRSSQFSIFPGGEEAVQEQWLTDSNGERHRYDILTITKQVRADEVGTITVGPVFLKANYPTGFTRDLFGRLEVTSSQSETARVDAVAVTVKAPPLEGRPPSYTGAIGRFNMNVSAAPTRVEVGQPITLTIAISGEPLTGVAGPNLTAQSELDARFDFTAEELVGDVERGAKVFRRAIFPQQEGEQTIPPIAWSYFDTQAEQYHTLTSEPIPIIVDPPSGGPLALPDTAANGTSLTLLAGGLSPNYTDTDALLAHQAVLPGGVTVGALIAAPAVYAGVAVVAWRRRRLGGDAALLRRRRAARRALRLLEDGDGSDPAARVEAASRALAAYLSDRFDLAPGQRTPQDVYTALCAGGASPALADEIQAFLAESQAVRYGPGSVEATPDAAAARVRHWIRQMERLGT